jgi:hypothetical protein
VFHIKRSGGRAQGSRRWRRPTTTTRFTPHFSLVEGTGRASVASSGAVVSETTSGIGWPRVSFLLPLDQGNIETLPSAIKTSPLNTHIYTLQYSQTPGSNLNGVCLRKHSLLGILYYARVGYPLYRRGVILKYVMQWLGTFSPD